MKTIEKNGIRYLYPEDGYMLKRDDTITDYLMLGVNDNGDSWEEITLVEAEEIINSQQEIADEELNKI